MRDTGGRPQFQVIGRPTTRVEGACKVSGKTVYAADVNLPGMIWGKCLRSPLPHAKIRRINTAKAKRLPGVLGVLTAEDLPNVRVGLRLRDLPLLARGKVRFVGEKVAVVAAEEPALAEEALSLIEVDYEELPAVFDPWKTMEPGAPIIHEELSSYTGFSHPSIDRPNVFSLQKWERGDLEAGFGEADLIVEHTFRTQLSHQGYIEPHAAVVVLDGSGRVEIWASCKAPFRLKEHLSEQVGIPENQIRVNIVAVGGDFGGKSALMDIPLCYFLAKATGRPVKMVMSYSEELAAGNLNHPSVVRLKSGIKRDGRIVAREAEVIFNSGSYAAFKPTETANLGGAAYATGVYRIPNFSIRSYGIYTNTVPGGFYRAPGQPQVVFAAESHMDLIARELGIDPLELRLKNLLSDGDSLPMGRTLERVRCREVLQEAAKKAGWGKAKKKPGVGYGIGVCFRPVGIWGTEEANVRIRVSPDGRITIVSAIPDTGTGVHTILSQITAELLTVSPEEIEVIVGNTGTFPGDAEPGGSKITTMAGQAALAAARELREKLESLAASMLGVDKTKIILERGRFRTILRPRRLARFAEVARYAEKHHISLDIQKSYQPTGRYPVVSFFAQIAEVEADRETGVLKVRRIVTAHDVGTIINPVAHQGQIEGGAIQGLGYALMEEVVTEEGKNVTLNLGDYRIPCMKDIPQLATVLVKDPAGPGPFAAKHIGENGIVPTAAAVANALDDAVGVRVFDLPISAEKVYAALSSRNSASTLQ